MTYDYARLKRISKRREAASDEWRAEVLAAHAAGESLRKIGEAAGVSHVRVLQIVQEASRG